MRVRIEVEVDDDLYVIERETEHYRTIINKSYPSPAEFMRDTAHRLSLSLES